MHLPDAWRFPDFCMVRSGRLSVCGVNNAIPLSHIWRRMTSKWFAGFLFVECGMLERWFGSNRRDCIFAVALERDETSKLDDENLNFIDRLIFLSVEASNSS